MRQSQFAQQIVIVKINTSVAA